MAQSALNRRNCPKCGAAIDAALSGEVACRRCGYICEDSRNSFRKSRISWRPRWFRNLSVSFCVSLLLHLILIGTLWFIVIEPQIIRFDFVTTLIRDLDDGRFDSLGFIIDPESPSELQPDEPPAAAMDAVETMGLDQSGDPGVAPEVSLGAFTGNGESGIGRSSNGTGIGGSDIAAGFSTVAAGRLLRHASVRPGTYEIALFWDGPSDLDVHVYYQSFDQNSWRVINYLNMGRPATGFLDLDQNADKPYNDEPIEHIRWKPKKPPAGYYLVLVHGYELRSKRTLTPERISYIVEIKTPDGVKSYRGSVTPYAYSYVEILTMGRNGELSIEKQAEQVLHAAKLRIVENQDFVGTSGALLELVVRQFPTSAAAKQATEMLRVLKRH